MNDLNRHEFPNGGWAFRQPQTNWVNPYAKVGFDASVKEIIKHRKANPAITAKHRLSTDYKTVADELEKYTRLRLGIPLPAPPSFFQQSSNQISSSVAAVAADIKKSASGMAVVLDWLGAGGEPVVQELAEKRAAICVSCPKNVAAAWYIEAAGNILKSSIEAWQGLKKSKFSFETEQGERLKSCDVCKCLMRLKVFCPLEHILEKTKPDVMKEFPTNCWVYRRDQ